MDHFCEHLEQSVDPQLERPVIFYLRPGNSEFTSDKLVSIWYRQDVVMVQLLVNKETKVPSRRVNNRRETLGLSGLFYEVANGLVFGVTEVTYLLWDALC